MAERIGYLGPGLMGRGIVRRLLDSGFPVMICAHRKGLEVEDLLRAGASLTTSLAELGERSTTIMLTVPSSVEVEAAILGADGLLGALPEGSVVIDLGTSLPSSTRMLAARLGDRGIGMLEAPMSGGPKQAAAGELKLMVGGEERVYGRCLPILRTIAQTVTYVGGPGSGHTVKLINNFLAQVNNAAIAEVLPLAIMGGDFRDRGPGVHGSPVDAIPSGFCRREAARPAWPPRCLLGAGAANSGGHRGPASEPPGGKSAPQRLSRPWPVAMGGGGLRSFG